MKEYSKFKCQPCGKSANRHNRIHSLECDLGGTVEARSGWRKFRDLVQLLVSRVLSLGAKSRLCFCMCKQFLLYGCETSPIKEEDVVSLQRNDARMVRGIYYVRPEDRISADELTTRLKQSSMMGVYRKEDHNGLLVWKKGRKCLVQ